MAGCAPQPTCQLLPAMPCCSPSPQPHHPCPSPARSAFRELDGTEHLGVGKLVVSFSNPVKASDPHRGPGTGTGVNRPMGTQRGGQGGTGAGGRGGGGGGGAPGGMMVRKKGGRVLSQWHCRLGLRCAIAWRWR